MACQIAKTPGYTIMAGQMLNMILEELWETNDFMFSRQTTTIDCTQAMPSTGYPLPVLHERTLEVFYTVNGAPRFVTQVPIADFDGLFQGITGSSYPEFFAVDVSQTPHTILVYPIPPLAVGITMRYVPQQVAITTPETSAAIPWFPSQMYLLKRLAAEIMMVSDDDRHEMFIKDANAIMSKFMTMGDDDREGYTRQVKMDPRTFRSGGSLKNTKSMPI